MRIIFSEDSWTDYLLWQRADRGMATRLNGLISDCMRHPFTGLGKPEPLRSEMAGWWSRRIDQEHRLVYRVIGKGADQHLRSRPAAFTIDLVDRVFLE